MGAFSYIVTKQPSGEKVTCFPGYHVRTNTRDGFLSMDFGLMAFDLEGKKVRLAHYRRFALFPCGIQNLPEPRSFPSVQRTN